MDSLAEMHLLLREAGWVPEEDRDAPHFSTAQAMWHWSHSDHKVTFGTWKLEDGRVEWVDSERIEKLKRKAPSNSVDALRRRLKALAKK